MLDVMYDLPSQIDVEECVVNEEVVLNNDRPILLYHSQSRESA